MCKDYKNLMNAYSAFTFNPLNKSKFSDYIFILFQCEIVLK